MEFEKNFLSFIEPLSPLAAQSAKKMEELVYEDSASSIIKARLFAEEMLKVIYTIEEIELPYKFSLYEMISYLSSNKFIEDDIQKNFETIRIIGNKAAHQAGYDDLSIAIKLHKVMYDVAVWFFESYSNDHDTQLPAYEYPKPQNKGLPQDELTSMIEKQLSKLLRKEVPADENGEETNKDKNIPPVNVVKENNKEYEEELDLTLLEGQSYLLRELKRLQGSSQEAIENASSFSKFKIYLHVERKIQTDFEEILNSNKQNKTNNLILLCGSVGDGKSHLLAYLKSNTNLLDEYEIFNDATESFSPNKNALETLKEILNDFSDQNIESSTKKVILAINMGVLHNFISQKFEGYTYERLKEFVNNSDVFGQSVTTKYSENQFDLISFSDYQSFEIRKSGVESNFFESLLKKVCDPDMNNPFYKSYKKDKENNIYSIIHENYEFLSNEYVQKQIVNLIIKAIIKNKIVVSARSFLNFVSDILIPDELVSEAEMTPFLKLESTLPNLLFNKNDRSELLNLISSLDPIHLRSEHIDQLMIQLNTSNNLESVFDEFIENKNAKHWLIPFLMEDELVKGTFIRFSESFLRITFLLNEEFSKKNINVEFNNFINYLYSCERRDIKEIKSIYNLLKQAIFKWKGSPKGDYIFINKPTEKFRIAQSLTLKPSTNHFKLQNDEVLSAFKTYFLLGYSNNEGKEEFLEVDYFIFELLTKISNGYRPNKKDEEEGIKFIEFVEKVMQFGEKRNEILVYFPEDKRYYRLSRDEFGDEITFAFKKE
ncbi:DNA phosphorothioation-dependent restriction protein DptF [Bacillus sp. FJAT-25509]|uniref:DNA phosphorothioation-dependent restriction protein DptF n=1 Tax=Bacillus sp. FJAT-25509 TaxID=1712029 RepID=UPI0006FADFE6|nr:DNA phosphorothioation-dependent restriction protein DptF [Bacillus sp. FJAT-25509]KQL33526.1 DNA phosphorothioation-dependent restriction protein DptF [Bacillus sp. FJAT-25509]